ncbi:MAG: response regulator [Nostoc sp. ChiSLP02]|nr:response regulator [Nostoc sp. DedSLP05]MDZ8101402.1 response regulator [Nostoc sp. DedSLP01]MDZ8185278.1 response regulator [Nostoc sp. ChiSLP02]
MILFIDDEERGIASFVEELKLSKFETTLKKDVNSALKYLEDNHDKIQLVILDVMMPAEEIFKDCDTNDGLRTGVHFHRKIRKSFPNLPIIIFTNFSDDELEQESNKDRKSRFLHKYDYLPFEFVEEVRKALNEQ